MEPRKCTNPYLPEGYKLTDENGNTIAVLIDGRFKRWAAGAWQPKRLREGIKGLKQFRAAMRESRRKG